MPTSSAISQPHRAASESAARRRPWHSSVPAARAIVVHALLLGVVADALLHEFPGLAFPLWVGLLCLATPSLTWSGGRTVPREASAWLATALLFAAGFAWRDAGALQGLDVLAVAGALGMAAIAIADERRSLFAERLRVTIWSVAALLRSIASGIVPAALVVARAPDTLQRWASGTRPVLRATLLAGALMLVFGALLRGADPIFASFVDLPDLDVGSVIPHLIVMGFFTWIVAGWALGAAGAAAATSHAPDSLPIGLGMLDITAALGTLNVLFAVFVVSQLGWFFGGERFLHERTGLTAAEYARQGFFQMVWVVLLVVPLLLATRAALRPGAGHALARRHTALSLPLIALLGAMILSAVSRMRLYVHYFGLTTDRLYPMVFMGWLAIVLVWLALTVLRDRGRPFVAGAVISAGIVLGVLNLAVPDRIAASVNVARALRGDPGAETALDVSYLAQLSGEAVDLAVAAALAPPVARGDSLRRTDADKQRCEATKRLLGRWGPGSLAAQRLERDAAWRFWNAGEAHALRVVNAHTRGLRAAQHESCGQTR
jgi:hypothetical protein